MAEEARGAGRARGGIDLGGTKILAVVVDAQGTVLGQARHPTPRVGGPRAVAEEMAATLTEAASLAGLAPAQLTAVGVGAPGTSDANAGTLAHALNVSPEWAAPYPLAATLTSLLGPPVHLANDVQVAIEAEYRLGAGRGFRSVLGVWWGTGVGGGLMLDGRLWRGRGSAGEIGHTVVRRGGALCGCGRRGCLEAYAGRACMEVRARRAVEKKGMRSHLFELMEKKGAPRLTSGIWQKALEKGDALAAHLVHRAVKMLGTGIASAINLLDVEAVVLGGGMGTRLGPVLSEQLRAAMLPHLFVAERPPALRVAELGDLSGAMGAALLAAEAEAGSPGVTL